MASDAIMNVRKLIRFFDAHTGKPLGKIVSLYYQGNKTRGPHPKKIIFIKLWAIGESILTLPALKALSKQFPDSTITVLTTPYTKDVFRNHPFIHNVDVVPTNPFLYIWYILRHSQKFDISIDGEPYFFASAIATRMLGRHSIGFATCKRDFLYDKQIPYNDRQHVVTTYLDLMKGAGVKGDKPITLIPLHTSPKDTELSMASPFIVLCPSVGKSATGRMWPSDRFVALANSLSTNKKIPIIFLGSKEDAPLLSALQKQTFQKSFVLSTLSIPQAAFVLGQATLVVANDSGLMHLAATMGTPTLGLFGPNTPKRFAPYNPKSRWIYRPCQDSPHIHVHRGEIPEIACSCMENISVSEVLGVASEMQTIYD